MSELKQLNTQPTTDKEVTHEYTSTTIDMELAHNATIITMEKEVAHESESDDKFAHALTPDENADNKSKSNDEIANAHTSDEKAENKSKSKDEIANAPTSDKRADNKAKSNDEIANAPTSDETADNKSTSNDEIANAPTSDEKADNKFKSNDEIANAPTLDEKIKDYWQLHELLKGRGKTEYLHFKVKRKKCLRCCSYYHHFLLLEVIEPEKKEQKEDQNGNEKKKETKENKNKDEQKTIKVMVAHYTSSKEIFTNNSKFGIGKFISETIIVGNKYKARNELFDLNSGLFLVNPPTSKAAHTIRERLYKRLGERIYDFGANNCEHAVNYILTGESESNEANSRPRCADLVSAAFGELKEVGLKVAMMIALVSSLAGSLTRYSYVRLLIAGVAAQSSKIGINETCSNLLGDNIIHEAKVVLDKHSEIPRFSEITSSEEIITDIKASLNNPFLCRIAELLAMEAIKKTFWLSLCMSVSVETMFLIKRIFFVYKPLFEIHKENKSKKGLFRMIFVRLVAGYLSIPIGILGGSVGQAFMSPPALYFFIFAFFASIITRYILTIVASYMYDCLYCFYGCCKDMCSDCCCTYCCMSCSLKQCICYSAAVLCYLLCIAGILVALYYFLD